MDVHVADINGDGYLDIVTASMHDNTIAWYENNKDRNPTFTKEDTISQQMQIVLMAYLLLI